MSASKEGSAPGAEPAVVPLKVGKTSTQKFKEADEMYEGKLESLSMKERALKGLPYLANDEAMTQARMKARWLLQEYNSSRSGPGHEGEVGANDMSNEKRRGIISELFQVDEQKAKRIFVEPPFWCDFGSNIKFEGDFYCNFNTTILDCAEVKIGHGVLFGPNVHIYSATHSVSVTEREVGLERALPVSIGTNCWIGGNVTIIIVPSLNQTLPNFKSPFPPSPFPLSRSPFLRAGVSIGKGCTIGAGSVVTRDIPDWSVAVGNPARVVKTLAEEERGSDKPSGAVPF
ncbi:trimeric LpxA-like protein [Violaceomyces palustris]|uniref:Trimeric LpxA-like protein n=1 Tax=Violaceomyces palustris TaxID=1673888 RepID=A0ACD0NM95_9BASI|nr:trimeric LpxA-like protein [Violaceomyces palustris]